MLLALLLACAPKVAPAPPAAAPVDPVDPVDPVGSPYPADYRPTGLDGAELPFSTWQGRPVLVNVWASWCPPCIEELPVLLDVDAAWGPRGLQVVGVAIDDQPARVAATADARAMGWPQALDGSNRASVVFDTVELPTTLLYGADGRLLFKHVGPLSAGDPAMTAALELALGQLARP